MFEEQQEKQTCRRCNEPIKFIKTKNGKFMPVNLDKKLFVTEDGYVNKGYESHFATCPFADEFRKKDNSNY